MTGVDEAGAGPLLAVQNLSKHFATRGWAARGRALKAVDGISFELKRGETLAIVGESGSGKSTLARTILRLVEPTSGAVCVGDQDLLKMTAGQMRDARRHIQMIFQDPYASLHPRRTVAEAVSEPWRVHRGLVETKAYAARVGELLEQVGLSRSYAAAYPGRLSGGERQRIAIARALAMRPDILILDEPVSALDVSIQAQVITLLMRLQRELGMAYVFISHDLALVRLVANRVAVMYRGRFVEEGPAEQVYVNPQHPYTQLLLNSRPGQQATLPEAPTIVDPQVGGSGGCSFRPRCSKAQQICAEAEPTLDTGRDGTCGCACHFAGATSAG